MKQYTKEHNTKEGFIKCLLGSKKGVSSKRFTLIVMCFLYTVIVIASTFFNRNVNEHIINSMVVIIGICLGSVAVTNFIKDK